jgi:four helix bundle protein
MDAERGLDHERLHAYQLSRQFARESTVLVQHLPPGRADMVEQLRKTALSIPLNIAEGGGEFAPKEKARFYRIAKRSATEAAAILDHMVDLQLTSDHAIYSPKQLLVRIVSTLTRLIKVSTAPE